jgi:hypothetical protein
VHDIDVELSHPSFLHGPAQCMLAADGTVDADDDAASVSRLVHGLIVHGGPFGQ